MLHYNKVPYIVSTLASSSSVSFVVYLWFTYIPSEHWPFWFLIFSSLIASVLDHGDRFRPTTVKACNGLYPRCGSHLTWRLEVVYIQVTPTIPLHSALLSSLYSLHFFIFLYFFSMLAHVCLVHFESRWRLRPFLFGLVNPCSKRACCPTFLFSIFCDHLEHYTGVWFWSSVKICSALRIQSLFQSHISIVFSCPLVLMLLS